MINEKNHYLDFIQEFEKFITASKQGKRTKQNGLKISKESVKRVEVTYKTLKDFSELKKFSLLFRISKQTNKREVARQKKIWNSFYQKFCDYLYYDLDCYDNYVGSVIKDIKTFLNYLITEKNLSVGNYHKKFYIYKEEIEIITLQPEQLNFLIYNKDFEKSLSKILLKIKDIFVVGCTVALRYSDLINLQYLLILKYRMECGT